LLHKQQARWPKWKIFAFKLSLSGYKYNSK